MTGFKFRIDEDTIATARDGVITITQRDLAGGDRQNHVFVDVGRLSDLITAYFNHDA